MADRLIQQALLQVLQPLIDPTFSQHDGFRPGQSVRRSVGGSKAPSVRLQERAGHGPEKFFNRLNLDILMDGPAKRIADGRVPRLTRRHLQMDILAHG